MPLPQKRAAFHRLAPYSAVEDLEYPYEFDYTDANAPNQSEAAGSDSAHAVYERKVQLAHPREVRAELRLKEAPQANAGEMLAAASLLFYVKSNHRLGYVRARSETPTGFITLAIC